MKTVRIMLITIVVMLNLVFVATAYADTEENSNDIRVDINGKFVVFSQETGYPFLDENKRTQVPLRAAMEAFGCQVSWDAGQSVAIVEKNGIKVQVPVGQNYIKKDNLEIFNDTKALLKNNRVYLPIRAVVEAFGAEVGWNQETDTVIITSLDSGTNIMSVHFIDVGHGDSILIDNGSYEVLIDGGTASSGAIVSDYIKPYVDGSLDLLISTHGHQDHVGGLPKIFEDYQIDRVIESGSFVDTPEWYAYKKALESEPDCIISEDADEIIDIADGIKLNIMEILDGQEIENNNSVTALLTYNNVSVLLTGDNQAEAETIIAQKVGKVDVFKGAHHGSYNANSDTLLNVIKPEYVVISAGKGVNYTHPHASALKRMFNTGATVYGTYISGTIVMKTNGASYSFDTATSGETFTPKLLIPLQITDAGTYQKNIR